MSNVYINSTESLVYFIAHNSADVVHHGALEPGIGVETGQPHLEIFYTENEWNNRKVELETKEN